MTYNFKPLDLLSVTYRAVLYLVNLPAFNTSNVMMMVITMKSGTQPVMLLAVKLLDPRQDAAFNQTLKITVHAGKPALIKLLLKLYPNLFRRQMSLPINKKLNDRLPARGELKPAFF